MKTIIFLLLYLPQLALASSYCNSLSDLKRNLTIETDYKYDFHEFSVPAKYKTEFNKDLFGNVYAETTQVNSGYTGSSLDAVYVYVKLTNLCNNRVKFRYEIKAEEKKKLVNTATMLLGAAIAVTINEASPKLAQSYLKSQEDHMGYIKKKQFDIEIDSGESEYTVGKIPLMVELTNAPVVTIISMENDKGSSGGLTEQEISDCEILAENGDFCKKKYCDPPVLPEVRGICR